MNNIDILLIATLSTLSFCLTGCDTIYNCRIKVNCPTPQKTEQQRLVAVDTFIQAANSRNMQIDKTYFVPTNRPANTINTEWIEHFEFNKGATNHLFAHGCNYPNLCYYETTNSFVYLIRTMDGPFTPKKFSNLCTELKTKLTDTFGSNNVTQSR